MRLEAEISERVKVVHSSIRTGYRSATRNSKDKCLVLIILGRIYAGIMLEPLWSVLFLLEVRVMTG